MKRILLAAALTLGIIGSAAAQSYYGINQGSIANTVHAAAVSTGIGSSYSVAKGDASSTAHLQVSTSGLPGYTGQQQALAAQTSTSANGMAYNLSTGAGYGSALSTGVAAANANGWTAYSTPHQSLNLAGNATSTSTGSVVAGTAQDGFYGSAATAGFAANGYVGSTGIAGGSALVGGVNDSKYATADTGSGGVTFPGGAPAGQTGAVRGATAEGVSTVTGSYMDPAGQ